MLISYIIFAVFPEVIIGNGLLWEVRECIAVYIYLWFGRESVDLKRFA
jgi:hypothetical protein